MWFGFNPRARNESCPTSLSITIPGVTQVSILEHEMNRARHIAARDDEIDRQVSILEHEMNRARLEPQLREKTWIGLFQSSSTK